MNLGRNDILPLHLACVHKSFAAGRVLVEIGASVNPRLPEYLTGLCSTPMHLLLENVKHRQALKCLSVILTHFPFPFHRTYSMQPVA